MISNANNWLRGSRMRLVRARCLQRVNLRRILTNWPSQAKPMPARLNSIAKWLTRWFRMLFRQWWHWAWNLLSRKIRCSSPKKSAQTKIMIPNSVQRLPLIQFYWPVSMIVKQSFGKSTRMASVSSFWISTKASLSSHKRACSSLKGMMKGRSTTRLWTIWKNSADSASLH